MFLLFLQNFWWWNFSITISLDVKLNFMLKLFNNASAIPMHLRCQFCFLKILICFCLLFSSSESFYFNHRHVWDVWNSEKICWNCYFLQCNGTVNRKMLRVFSKKGFFFRHRYLRLSSIGAVLIPNEIESVHFLYNTNCLKRFEEGYKKYKLKKHENWNI